MARVELDAIAREKALSPGDVLELEYTLATSNSYLIGLWLSDIEADLEKEAPLWRYKSYTWNPDEPKITFEMELGNYVSDLETGKIIPQYPDGRFKEPVTKYYASPAYIYVAISVVFLGACAALAVRDVTIYLREKQIVESDLPAIEKAEALKDVNKGVLDDAGELVDKVAIGIVVALIVAAIFGASR